MAKRIVRNVLQDEESDDDEEDEDEKPEEVLGRGRRTAMLDARARVS